MKTLLIALAFSTGLARPATAATEVSVVSQSATVVVQPKSGVTWTVSQTSQPAFCVNVVAGSVTASSVTITDWKAASATLFVVNDAGKPLTMVPLASATFAIQSFAASARLTVTADPAATFFVTNDAAKPLTVVPLASATFAVQSVASFSAAALLTVAPAPTATFLETANLAVSGTRYVISQGPTGTSSGYTVDLVGGTAVNLLAGLPVWVTHVRVVNQSTSNSVFLGGADVGTTAFADTLVKWGGADGPNSIEFDLINKVQGLWADGLRTVATRLGVLAW